MSPDPQRSSEEEINSGTVYFMSVPDDEEDDFMADPNGDHELDFSSHESDFTDDDDEDEGNNASSTNVPNNMTTGNGPNNSVEDSISDNNTSTEVNGRMMARYQLLIPFPQPSTQDPSTSEGDGELEEIRFEPQQQQSPPATAESDVQSTSSTIIEPTTSSNDSPSDSITESQTENQQREIVMNEDKVEVIKNAMKNFSLPVTNIPPWVKEIDENSWKDTLVELTQK